MRSMRDVDDAFATQADILINPSRSVLWRRNVPNLGTLLALYEWLMVVVLEVCV